MAESQRPKGQNDILSSLNEAIDALTLAKAETITPAKAAFGATGDLLTTIRVGFPLACVDRLLANVYRTRWSGKRRLSN